MRRARISRSPRAKAPQDLFRRSSGSPRSATTSRCTPATSRARCAAATCRASARRRSAASARRTTRSRYRAVQEFVLRQRVGVDAATADDGARRRLEPRPVGDPAARAAGARRRGRRNSPRRPSVHGLRRRARSGRDQRARQRRVVRDESGVRARSPASGSCSTHERATRRWLRRRALWTVGILDLAGYVLEPSAEETLAPWTSSS